MNIPDCFFPSYGLLCGGEREAADGGRSAGQAGGGVSAEERH